MRQSNLVDDDCGSAVASEYDDARGSAIRLQRELSQLGITSDVHDGYRLAQLSVWVGLVVWCDGERFWWRTGWDAKRERVVYARHLSSDPARAACRIAHRYAQVREAQPCP
ncbi:hypothetical protein FXF51_37925 [Nonomuraea sp. PA05]|uniref:hypothetical protein n=1 Tax=Nonomuraea sp. PA05 TaxID=2604466 RepID=UPI0011D6F864|nr:hypothetical protein [Nonomuraea sp. PA05]TYB58040.1 hypothetical protein FXF51_37925 [Nonomuraea sp. PA05]